VVPNAKLLTAVWGVNCREEIEYLRVYVNQIRRKIEDDPSNPVYLLTDLYVGYRFVDPSAFDLDAGDVDVDLGSMQSEESGVCTV